MRTEPWKLETVPGSSQSERSSAHLALFTASHEQNKFILHALISFRPVAKVTADVVREIFLH